MGDAYRVKLSQAFAFCIVITALAAAILPSCNAIEAFEANGAINEAESRVNLVFVAVSEADAAGAGVGDLIAQLQIAGNLLSEAHAKFRIGDYDAASALALQCSTSVEPLISEAALLTAVAEREKTDNLLLTIIASSIGLISLLILGIVGWPLFEKRQREKLLRMKPEVEEPNES